MAGDTLGDDRSAAGPGPGAILLSQAPVSVTRTCAPASTCSGHVGSQGSCPSHGSRRRPRRLFSSSCPAVLLTDLSFSQTSLSRVSDIAASFPPAREVGHVTTAVCAAGWIRWPPAGGADLGSSGCGAGALQELFQCAEVEDHRGYAHRHRAPARTSTAICTDAVSTTAANPAAHARRPAQAGTQLPAPSKTVSRPRRWL
jgi:hypothetical protein